MKITSKSIRNIIARTLAVLMLLGSICLVFDARVFAADDYAQIGNELQTGDILRLQEGEWTRDFIVLNPVKTNTRKPGTFLIQKEVGEEVAFNFDRDPIAYPDYLNVANLWEGSLSQRWCEKYYRDLPPHIKSAVIGVKTVETESGSDWAGVNNIDGTRTDNTGYEKDKVFYLSFMEYDTYKDSAGLVDPNNKWHLRSPYNCGDLAVYVGIVDESGRVMQYGHTMKTGTRPAMNLDLTSFESVAKCKHGDKALWVINPDNDDPGYSSVEYQWSPDKKSCSATAICNNCGEEVSETAMVTSSVIKKATVKAKGTITHKAVFTNAAFETQIKTSDIPKRPLTAFNSKLPKPTIVAPKALKKGMTVKWKKLSAANQNKVQGIEIQYALNSKFTKKAVLKTAKKNASSRKITKLKSKKTYWVRVRTYKKVDGTKYYGKWSKVKKIKVK